MNPWQIPGDVLPALGRVLERVHGSGVWSYRLVLHEGNGRENRCADADFGDVLLDVILAVEMRSARLSVGGADRSENEMRARGLGRVGGCNTLSCLGVCAARRRRHREERGRSFEGLRERRSVFERRGNERRPGTRERLGLA